MNLDSLPMEGTLVLGMGREIWSFGISRLVGSFRGSRRHIQKSSSVMLGYLMNLYVHSLSLFSRPREKRGKLTKVLNWRMIQSKVVTSSCKFAIGQYTWCLITVTDVCSLLLTYRGRSHQALGLNEEEKEKKKKIVVCILPFIWCFFFNTVNRLL